MIPKDFDLVHMPEESGTSSKQGQAWWKTSELCHLPAAAPWWSALKIHIPKEFFPTSFFRTQQVPHNTDARRTKTPGGRIRERLSGRERQRQHNIFVRWRGDTSHVSLLGADLGPAPLRAHRAPSEKTTLKLFKRIYSLKRSFDTSWIKATSEAK